MDPEALDRLAHSTRCRVFGHEDAGNAPHRAVLAALIRGFDRAEATVLCEPSLARKTTRPPDCVLVDPVAGVHVVEVKGVRGTNPQFTITAGELERARADAAFRLTVVTAALSPSPVVHRYSGEGFRRQFRLDPIQYRAALRAFPRPREEVPDPSSRV